MPGRPKKPIALKKLQGTYRKDRDTETNTREEVINSVLPESRLKVPKSIKDPAVRKAYKEHISLLHSIGPLAEQVADSPLLEYAYKNLEMAKETFSILLQESPTSDKYARAEKSFLTCTREYERIVKEFYLTPSARAKLKIDCLTATEKTLNIEKEKNIIASLLAKKQS